MGIIPGPTTAPFSASALAAGLATSTGAAALDYRTAVSVKDPRYGARGDGLEFVAAGGMTATQTTLTVTGGTFTSADFGKRIVVFGAGAAGARLNSTISAVTSATQVTLAAAAGTTVAAATVAYGSDDTTAIQAAVNAASEVYVPPGIYFVTTWIKLKSNLRIYGAGAASVLYNDKSNATADLQACLLAGLGHPSAVSGGIWPGYALSALAAQDKSITFTTSSDAGNFVDGEIALVGDSGNVSGVLNSGQFVKIKSRSGAVMQINDAIVRAVASPKIYKITGTDSSTSTGYYAIENLIVEKLAFKGRAGIATKACFYNCLFRDLHFLDVHSAIGFINAGTRSKVETIRGEFSGRMLEVAQNSHNMIIRDIELQFKAIQGLQVGETQVQPINLGEQSTKIVLDRVNCKVDSNFTVANQLAQIKVYDLSVTDCDWYHGGTQNQECLSIPSSTATGYPYDLIQFVNCQFGVNSAKARIGIVGTSSTDAPKRIELRGGQLYGAPSSEALWFQFTQTAPRFDCQNNSGKALKVSSTATLPEQINQVTILQPGDFDLLSGTAALATWAGGRSKLWSMPSAADSTIYSMVPVPGWASLVKVELLLTNMGAGTGNILARLTWASIANAGAAGSGHANLDNTIAAPAQDVLQRSQLSAGLIVTGGGLLMLRLVRAGSVTATDTLGNAAGFIGLILTFSG